MNVDGRRVEIGQILYDAQLGGGQVKELYNDSFAVAFGKTTRVYFDGGLMAGRQLLTIAKPFVIEPRPDQMALVLKLLNAIEVKHNH